MSSTLPMTQLLAIQVLLEEFCTETSITLAVRPSIIRCWLHRAPLQVPRTFALQLGLTAGSGHPSISAI